MKWSTFNVSPTEWISFNHANRLTFVAKFIDSRRIGLIPFNSNHWLGLFGSRTNRWRCSLRERDPGFHDAVPYSRFCRVPARLLARDWIAFGI
jgi:hypothetical protein